MVVWLFAHKYKCMNAENFILRYRTSKTEMIHIIIIEYSPIPQRIFRSFRTLKLTECTRGIKQGSIKGEAYL